jgi:hypothetical protein
MLDLISTLTNHNTSVHTTYRYNSGIKHTNVSTYLVPTKYLIILPTYVHSDHLIPYLVIYHAYSIILIITYLHRSHIHSLLLYL